MDGKLMHLCYQCANGLSSGAVYKSRGDKCTCDLCGKLRVCDLYTVQWKRGTAK